MNSVMQRDSCLIQDTEVDKQPRHRFTVDTTMQILPTISPEKAESCLGLHHSRIPDTKTSWNHVVGASSTCHWYIHPNIVHLTLPLIFSCTHLIQA